MLTAIKTVPIDNRVVAGSNPAVGISRCSSVGRARHTKKSILTKGSPHCGDFLFTKFYNKNAQTLLTIQTGLSIFELSNETNRPQGKGLQL